MIIGHIFRNVHAEQWPNFQITVAFHTENIMNTTVWLILLQKWQSF